MNSPKISVVMPVYNPEPAFFHDAIASVLNQTCQPFEIIISDDTENEQIVKSIIENLKQQNTVIRYFHHKGEKGIFSNLNNAIRHAEGDFIQILCQDDEMKPNCLEEQKRTLVEYSDVGIVFSQFDVIS